MSIFDIAMTVIKWGLGIILALAIVTIVVVIIGGILEAVFLGESSGDQYERPSKDRAKGKDQRILDAWDD